MFVDFEWDVAKAESNFEKHSVSFEAATLAFYDPGAVYEQDRVVDGEVRWHVIGLAGSVCLLVVHTSSEDGEVERIRIISARQTDKRERRTYERANR